MLAIAIEITSSHWSVLSFNVGTTLLVQAACPLDNSTDTQATSVYKHYGLMTSPYLLLVTVSLRSNLSRAKCTVQVGMSYRLYYVHLISWWRHQMETFSTLLAFCVGNSPVTGEFPSQRPVTWSFDVFFDLHLNKPLGKQSWGWWFETTSHSLWLHCNDLCMSLLIQSCPVS